MRYIVFVLFLVSFSSALANGTGGQEGNRHPKSGSGAEGNLRSADRARKS